MRLLEHLKMLLRWNLEWMMPRMKPKKIIADVLDLMLNVKMKSRQKPSNTAVKSVIEVSCTDVEKE